MINLNPELIAMRNDEVTIEKLAREYSVKQVLKAHYADKARAVGMSLEGYCKRFNINLK